MPDDLIHDDVLVWSERQAALLRRLARGERVNDAIDWENVIEEIEALGRSELHSVNSLLVRAITHLMKITVWPQGPVWHWRNEVVTFLNDARSRWAPSMAQRMDIEDLYKSARAILSKSHLDGYPVRGVPERCPFALSDFILPEKHAIPDIDALLARLAAG